VKRWHWILVAVLAGEVVIGAVLVYREWSRPAAPIGEPSYVDPLTARQLRQLARKCRTPDDWRGLGLAYMAYGYFSEAEASCRQAAALAPTRPDLIYDWAFALERLGRHTEAIAEYQRAIELAHAKPDDCWYYVGRNWLRLEKADEAREAFAKAAKQPSARYEIARLLVRTGQWQDAVQLLDELSAAHPKAVQPYLLRYRIETFRDSALMGL
jgi:tetratricopeptide (TPR) repeat protein